jgi:hypothetical protein
MKGEKPHRFDSGTPPDKSVDERSAVKTWATIHEVPGRVLLQIPFQLLWWDLLVTCEVVDAEVIIDMRTIPCKDCCFSKKR